MPPAAKASQASAPVKGNDRQLLQVYADVLEELRNRGTLRSGNNPVADYAEALCARAFDWTLVTKSTKGHDAVDANGRRIEIKARRITIHNPSRQLSAIRGLEDRHFARLAGVLVDAQFRVLRAALIPYRVVQAEATFVVRTNSWRFLLRDGVWKLAGVVDITDELKKAQR
jgi:hypothetical protein